MISESERTVYERSELPLAVCSLRDDRIRADIVSDGLCASFHLDREAMHAALRSGMRAVWFCPQPRAEAAPTGVPRIARLTELPALLPELGREGA